MTTLLALVFDSAGPCLSVNDLAVRSAPTLDELLSVLGQPSREFTGERPAPPNHRNNVVHIYDDWGLTMNEHHYTRRIQDISCYFTVEDPEFRFTPRMAFSAQLVIDGIQVPADGSCQAFLERCPLSLEPGLAGMWSWKRDGFSLHVRSRGPWLRSGRRSKTKSLVSVSFAWPHDRWSKPAESTRER